MFPYNLDGGSVSTVDFQLSLVNQNKKTTIYGVLFFYIIL